MSRPPRTAPQLLTVAQVAERMGVSVRTVERFVSRGELPAINVGSGTRPRLRIPESALIDLYGNRAV